MSEHLFLNAFIASYIRRKHGDLKEVQRQVKSTGCDSHKAEWRTKVPGAENRKVRVRSKEKREKERSQVEQGGGGGKRAGRAPVGG